MNSIFRFSRLAAVARKEAMHILRDPFTVALALGLPIILVVYFGYAIDFDFKGIKTAFYDFDQTRQSRELEQTFGSSGYFTVFRPGHGVLPDRLLDGGKATAAVVVYPGFAREILSGKTPRVQILLDGTDNSKSGVVSGYLAQLQGAAAEKITGSAPKSPARIVTRFFYNPELNTRWFIVPGLITVVVGLLSILMTALTVAREWENGSMELLMSTPITPLEIVLGKMLPYALLVFGGISLVYVTSRTVFGIPFAGSHLLFAAACLIYITTSLSIGLLISVITRQQQIAMQVSMLSGLLPSLLLSGFIFPIESMPVFFQYFTMILPPRWFMEIIRGIFLKGAGTAELAVPLSALLALQVIIVGIASTKFKRDLE